MMLVAVACLTLLSPCLARDLLQAAAATPAASDSQEERMKFAAHTIGVNSAFMEVRHVHFRSLLLCTNIL